MRPDFSPWTRRSGVFIAAVLAIAVPTGIAGAVGGTSTAGAIVTAVNPASARAEGDFQIVLTARAEKGTVDGSCRPQDATSTCSGSLVLRIADAGGLSVAKLEVHRVAVGDISCGDDHDGACGGDHDEGGCEGHDDGCAGVAPSIARAGVDQPVHALVNGVATLRHPGTTREPAGAKVQVRILLTDNGDELYTDTVDVQINTFLPGPEKPELYRSGPRTIKQVKIHLTQS